MFFPVLPATEGHEPHVSEELEHLADGEQVATVVHQGLAHGDGKLADGQVAADWVLQHTK